MAIHAVVVITVVCVHEKKESNVPIEQLLCISFGELVLLIKKIGACTIEDLFIVRFALQKCGH